jgi:hypothetical protein
MAQLPIATLMVHPRALAALAAVLASPAPTSALAAEVLCRVLTQDLAPWRPQLQPLLPVLLAVAAAHAPLASIPGEDGTPVAAAAGTAEEAAAEVRAPHARRRRTSAARPQWTAAAEAAAGPAGLPPGWECQAGRGPS